MHGLTVNLALGQFSNLNLTHNLMVGFWPHNNRPDCPTVLEGSGGQVDRPVCLSVRTTGLHVFSCCPACVSGCVCVYLCVIVLLSNS